MSWHDKAHKIIAAECSREYRAANTRPDGKRYRSHKPYPVPEIAAALVDCLNRDDEYEAKRLFIVYSTGALSLI
jgi:hypothetical protein